MNGTSRSPHDRWLPAWLGMSLALHLAVLGGGGALVDGRRPQVVEAPATQVLVAGRIVPPDHEPNMHTTAGRTELASAARHDFPQHRAAQRVARPVARSAMGVTPSPHTPPARAVGGFADWSSSTGPRQSAAAPRLGQVGAPWAGPLAGGGAEALSAQGAPVSFQVAEAFEGGGIGPGYGGAGSGLGVGGASSGVGGGGASGGHGLSSGGTGGSTTGEIRPTGLVGGGGTPGMGAGSGGGSASAPSGTGAKSQPTHTTSASAPAPLRSHEPAPAPVTREEPQPEPEPQPSAADLSAFRAMVQSRISAAKRYPPTARDAGEEGTVKVGFSVSPSGQPSGISVVSSSGYQALDVAAQRAVAAAAPYLPFPRHVRSSIRVTATVIFRLN